jgi:glycosyltransferase involved in cell wall biosynthesis
MTAPRISIVIPAYRHEAYIAETLASIATQPVRDVEVIVVDDGSPDGTLAIAQTIAASYPLPITVVSQPNAGTCAALNHGLRLAQGALFAMIASDDVFAEDRFSAQLAAFDANPALEATYGNGRQWCGEQRFCRVHDASVLALLAQAPAQIHADLCQRDYPLFIQTALFKTATLRAVGGFDEVTGVDDWPLNIRLFRHFTRRDQYTVIDQDLVLYRQHPHQQYRDRFTWPARKIRVIEAYCPEPWRDAALARQYWLAGRELLYASIALEARFGRLLRLFGSLLEKFVKAGRPR